MTTDPTTLEALAPEDLALLTSETRACYPLLRGIIEEGRRAAVDDPKDSLPAPMHAAVEKVRRVVEVIDPALHGHISRFGRVFDVDIYRLAEGPFCAWEAAAGDKFIWDNM